VETVGTAWVTYGALKPPPAPTGVRAVP